MTESEVLTLIKHETVALWKAIEELKDHVRRLEKISKAFNEAGNALANDLAGLQRWESK